MEKQKIVTTFFRTSVIYFFGKIATYIVSFLMLKYYTENIKPAEYGQYEYYCSLFNVIVPVLFCEIWSGLLKFAINKSTEDKRRVITSVIFITLPLLLIYSIMYYIITRVVMIEYSSTMYVVSMLFLFLNILMMTSRAFDMNKSFAISGIIGAVINALVSYVLIEYFDYTIDALFYALVSNYVVQILFLIKDTKIYRYISFDSFDRAIAKKVIYFCLPFSVNTILYFINTNYYKIVVNKYLGNEILGTFTVSTKFCVIVTFIVSVFHLAWQELTYSQSEESSRVLLYNKGINIITYGVIVSTLAIIPFTKIISPFFIGDMYIDAIKYIPAYYITIYFTSISGFYYNTLAAENITIYHPVVKFFAAISNLVIIYLLIQHFGINAIILGAITCSVVEWILLTFISKRKIGISSHILVTLVFVLLYLIGSYIFTLSAKYNLLYLMFIIIISLYYIFKSSYADMFYSMINKIRK